MAITQRIRHFPLSALGVLLGTVLLMSSAMAAPGGISTGAYPSLKSYLGSPPSSTQLMEVIPMTQNVTPAVFSAPVFGKATFSLPAIAAPNMSRFSQPVFIPDTSVYAPFANLTGSGNITAFEDVSPSGSMFLFEDIGASGSLEPFEDVSDSGSSAVFEDYSPSGSSLPWDDITPSGSPFSLDI